MTEIITVPLGSLAHIDRGITWNASQEFPTGSPGTLPVLRIPNIKHKLDVGDLRYLRVAPGLDVDRYTLPPGSMVMVGSNGNAERVGNVAYIDTGDNYLYASFLIGIQPFMQINPRYLFQLISSPAVQNAITRSVQGSTGLKNLSKSFLQTIPVPLPSRDEQQKIAEILDTADESIRSTERLIAKLESTFAGIVYDLLTQGVDETGSSRNATDLVDTPAGPSPRSWKISTLGAQATLQRGFDITVAEQRPGTVPVVSSSGISSFHDRAMVRGPGVVIGRKGKLGNSYYIEEDYWPHDTSLWVKDFHGNNPKYISLLLAHLRLDRFDAATSVPTLNRNFIHPIRIALPGRGEQDRIVEYLDSLVIRLTSERQALRKLQKIKEGLTEDLLTGRVRVSVV